MSWHKSKTAKSKTVAEEYHLGFKLPSKTAKKRKTLKTVKTDKTSNYLTDFINKNRRLIERSYEHTKKSIADSGIPNALKRWQQKNPTLKSFLKNLIGSMKAGNLVDLLKKTITNRLAKNEVRKNYRVAEMLKSLNIIQFIRFKSNSNEEINADRLIYLGDSQYKYITLNAKEFIFTIVDWSLGTVKWIKTP